MERRHRQRSRRISHEFLSRSLAVFRRVRAFLINKSCRKKSCRKREAAVKWILFFKSWVECMRVNAHNISIAKTHLTNRTKCVCISFNGKQSHRNDPMSASKKKTNWKQTYCAATVCLAIFKSIKIEKKRKYAKTTNGRRKQSRNKRTNKQANKQTNKQNGERFL